MERELSLAHGRTRAIVEGPSEGPSVLFVCGMTYPLEVFGPLAASLAGLGWQVLRFDLYGRGGSSWDGAPLRVEVLAAQARAVLDAVQPGGAVHLVGLSNADLVLNAFARMWPERTRSLTWIAPSGVDARTMRPWVRALGSIPGVTTMTAESLRRRCLARMHSHRAHLPDSAPAMAGEAYARSIAFVEENASFPRAVLSHMLSLPRPSQVAADAAAVAAASIPVQLITFGEEFDATERGIAPLRAQVPDRIEVTIEQGTHMGLLECPERVLVHLQSFLQHTEAAP